LQEEVESRTVTLSISTAKLTGRVLKSAINKYLQHRKEKKQEKVRTSLAKLTGKQTVKQLIGQNAGVSNIEISESNIKDFDRVARKYGVDYAIKKDKTGEIPKYLVFFKARDADALTAAFSEYSSKVEKTKEKPSVIQKLRTLKLPQLKKDISKVRNKDKGLEI
jgi:hypothetical protein